MITREEKYKEDRKNNNKKKVAYKSDLTNAKYKEIKARYHSYDFWGNPFIAIHYYIGNNKT